MSLSENTPPHTTPKTTPSDQTSKQQLDELGNRLADVEVGLRKDAVMERLINALASKWEPNGIRKLSSGTANVDTKTTDWVRTAAVKP
jgi:hypothetical protein